MSYCAQHLLKGRSFTLTVDSSLLKCAFSVEFASSNICFFVFKLITIQPGKFDGFSSLLQMNPPLVLELSKIYDDENCRFTETSQK